jgi:hypothetical protein
MNGHLPGVAMMQLCQKLQDRACNSIACEHTGKSCDAAGCDNRVCKIHEHYCSGCESRYCEDCVEAHLEACRGPLVDGHDERIEQALGTGEEIGGTR